MIKFPFLLADCDSPRDAVWLADFVENSSFHVTLSSAWKFSQRPAFLSFDGLETQASRWGTWFTQRKVNMEKKQTASVELIA